MSDTKEKSVPKDCLKADDRAVIQGAKWRITVLTPELFRLEYSSDGQFTDEMTQIVVNRRFPVPEFQVKKTGDEIQIITENAELYYDGQPFSANGLSIRVRGNGGSGTWHYGNTRSGNLKGTARTLDQSEGEDLLYDGKLRMEDGLFSGAGYAVIDDSRSVTVQPDGTVHPRPAGITDLYFFGYGCRFHEGLRDYYHLTGKTPLIPRFALGNWWSRYHRYTEQEYKDLITRFEAERVPLSVAVIDMDWHLVQIDQKYGSGWTGYTWNTDLFPDYREFLAWLHAHGLKTSLNVHPADGVRGFEVMYPAMAKALGRDAAAEEPIPFDIADPAYVKAAFQYIYHPYEEDGVDFWWLDWQQGGVTKIAGLDPLWMLNFYHYEDSKRGGKRGLTFSRYAGPGSHRYPIGFSGDTIVSWKSLDFQPYFTATASNIGYGWWSHDIGGHMLGVKDEELTVRWVQLGVFSPILRLHTSNSEYMHKEPWLFRAEAREILDRFLRLRHALIPYLYAMNVRASRDDCPLIEPMYYEDPKNPLLYETCRNEYYFGDSMIVSPITAPRDQTGFASVRTWLPEGGWTDLFTGVHYCGNRMTVLVRDLTEIPALAKDGAMIPMTDLSPADYYTASTENPKHLLIKVFPGRDGTFTMTEDDGTGAEAIAERECLTNLTQTMDAQSGTLTVSIGAAEGNLSCIPAKRTWRVEIYLDGLQQRMAGDSAKGTMAGNASADTAEWTYAVHASAPVRNSSLDPVRNILTLDLGEAPVTEQITLTVSAHVQLAQESKQGTAQKSGTISAAKAANAPLSSNEGEKESVVLTGNGIRARLYRRLDGILTAAEMGNRDKTNLGESIQAGKSGHQILSDALAAPIPETVRKAFAELILAEN